MSTGSPVTMDYSISNDIGTLKEDAGSKIASMKAKSGSLRYGSEPFFSFDSSPEEAFFALTTDLCDQCGHTFEDHRIDSYDISSGACCIWDCNCTQFGVYL